MITVAFVASLLGICIQSVSEPDPLITSNFTVFAWYCAEAGCVSDPRRFEGDVVFAGARGRALLMRMKRRPASWKIVFNCAVSDDRLVRCRTEPDSVNAAVGEAMARRIVRQLRIPDRPTGGTADRSIVSVGYAPGSCPLCPHTLPPPPPPPAP